MSHPRRSLLVSLLLAASLALSACGAQAAQGPPPATPAAPEAAVAAASPAAAPPQPSRHVLSGVEMGRVYQLLLEQYVDPLDHKKLVGVASASMREELLKRYALPIDTLPLDLMAPASDDAARDWVEFGTAYSLIVNRRPEWADSARPDIAVLNAMLDSVGDSHTSYISADEVQRRSEESYTGIGVRLSKPVPESSPLIVEVFEKSPAERAGLHAGDQLLSVQDTDVAGMQLTDIADKIRGQEGTSVKLVVQHSGATAPTTIEVPREQLQIAIVEAKLASRGGGAPGIAYVRIRQFTDEVPEQAAAALAGMLGSGQAQGVVLDLRGNTGGSLRAVATLAGFFVEPGRPIGLEVDREKRQSPLYAEGTPLLPVPPMALLVDGGTGSGAEILAAALREYRLATLVGEQTAGSVAVGHVQNLSDGSQVQITVQRFVSPSGAQIDRVGVKPDEMIQLTPQNLSAGEDPQLQRALEIVEKQIAG